MSVTPKDETAAFEAVTTEAVGVQPESKQEESQELPGDESATTNAKGSGQEDGQDNDKEEGKDNAEGKSASDAGGDNDNRRGRGRFQKRIDRLSKRAAEAEKRAEEAESKLSAKSGESKAKAEEPDPDDFDDYDDYLGALTDWKAGNKADKPQDKSSKEADEKKSDEKPDVEFVDALDEVNDSFDDARKKYSDFDEIIGQEDLAITREMVIAMSDADDPGMIAYHLGKNKAEAARISKLGVIAQAKAIGKLEVMLANPKQPGKKLTSAPEPIDPLKGGSTTQKKPEDMSFDEYERTMNAKERKSGSFW